MTSIKTRFFASALSLTLCTPMAFSENPPTANVAESTTDTGDGVVFNFQDSDIQSVVKTISQLTGRNFLIDQRVKGKLTIISSQPVSKAAAYQIFLSALKAQGLAAVESPGGIMKIVPESEARLNAGVRSDAPSNSDQWITQIIPVQYASANQMVTMFKSVVEPNGQVSAYPQGNMLIVTAPSTVVRNVLRVIERLDKPGNREVTVIPLQNASASDVAQLIGRFPEGQAGGTESGMTIIPDIRTNSLLVRADNPARLESMRALIQKLDVKSVGVGQSRVVYLRHAQATKLVEVLRGLLNAPRPAGGTAATAGADSFIQADEASNALIINGPDGVYNNFRSIIEKLDVARAQIFVEALIAEVSSSRAAQFGIQFSGATTSGNQVIAGGVNFPGAGTPLTPAQSLVTPNGATIGILGDSVKLPDGTSVPGLFGLIRLLEQDNHVNILSTPTLLTLDNSMAKIVIGQNVPFVTGSYAQANGASGSGVNPFQTIDRKDVGLTLQIRPQISDGNEIKLQIYQEVSSVAPATANAQDIITNKRSIETEVIVNNGNIVALGGLIQDSVTDVVNAIPILGHIPIIGELFKYRSRQKEKLNLMVFLRPVIIASPEDLSRVTADRYDLMRSTEKSMKMQMTPFIPRYPEPVMPEWKENTAPRKLEPLKSDSVPVIEPAKP